MLRSSTEDCEDFLNFFRTWGTVGAYGHPLPPALGMSVCSDMFGSLCISHQRHSG
jgi:hypothetical protein